MSEKPYRYKSKVFLTTDKKGNVVLFTLEEGEKHFLKLHGISALIAKAIQKNELDKVRNAILQEYDVSGEQLELDINNLLVKLRDLDYIE